MIIIQFIQKPETIPSLSRFFFQSLQESESPAPSPRCSELTVDSLELIPDFLQSHKLHSASIPQPVQANRPALLIALPHLLKENCFQLSDAMKAVPLPCVVPVSSTFSIPQAPTLHAEEFASLQLLGLHADEHLLLPPPSH